MKKLLLNPEDNRNNRPQSQIDLIVNCFERRGIEATSQQAVLLWERISLEIYEVPWVKVPVNPENLWQILQGNRNFWKVEFDG